MNTSPVESGIACPELPSTTLRERAERDPHRPGFHFVAPAGWLNDPNGLGEWDGVFHLFYQYNPEEARHNHIQWGHATSTDMVHWRDEPVALTPSAGPDSAGCWSGVLVDDNGTPTLVYSGHDPEAGPTQTCCVATGDDALSTWTKHPGNPVIQGPPAGLDVTEMRDHTVWREGDDWHQLMGSGLRGEGGVLLHFSGPTLTEWEYRGIALHAKDVPPGGFLGTTWECPDLFAIDSKRPEHRVLVFSAWDEGQTLYPLYLTGRYVDGTFLPDGPARHLDLGLRHFYAPQSFPTSDGRRVQFGWAQEARPDADAHAAGWSGVMSLPRTLALDPEGGLVAAPVAEVDGLRLGEGELVTSQTTPTMARTTGDQLDISGAISLPVGGRFELGVRATRDAEEETLLRLERIQDRTVSLTLDRSRSRVAAPATGYDVSELGGTLPATPSDTVDLRVLVDHSIVEVFANGVPLTARVYPARADASSIWTRAEHSSARLTVWPLQSAGRCSS